MSRKKQIGLDQWRLYEPYLLVLQRAMKQNLELYDLEQHAAYTSCYAPILQRHEIRKAFAHSELLRTSGMLGYCLRTLRKPWRMSGMIAAVILWYVMSHMIYEIDIKGSDAQGIQLISDTLKDMNIAPPFYETDMQVIKQNLKKTLEHKIAWLEIQQSGSRYQISFTSKEFANIETLSNEELIAQRDGVIQRFDVLHGNKQYAVNQFVHKGDVLVSNVLDTSSNTKKELYVKGRVFAYTWKDVTVTINDDGMPKSMQYFDMLLSARSEISTYMKKDDQIYKENILQFSKELGKIKMVVHYTLIQDITTP